MRSLLYITVTNYQNKTLYKDVIFNTYFTNVLIFSHIRRAHPKLNNANDVVEYNI